MQQGLERDSADEVVEPGDAARTILAQVEEAGTISKEALRGTLEELDLSDQQVEDVYRALEAADITISEDVVEAEESERPVLDLSTREVLRQVAARDPNGRLGQFAQQFLDAL